MILNKPYIIKYAKYLGMLVAMAALAGVTWAAFSDKGRLTGSTFSVGSSDIKLLQNLANGVTPDNLRDELAGPNFTNLTPNWTQDYTFKIYNNGSTPMQLTSNSNYETVNDPDDLRSYIFVEPIEWGDTNVNGTVDTGEEGLSFGKKTFVKWKTEGFDLGRLDMGLIKGFILRFSTASLSDTKQGKTATYDFEINAIQL